MPKITNRKYRKFLDEGMIEKVSEEQLGQILDGIIHRHKFQAQALVAVLYYTGARPAEVLNIKRNDFNREKSYITIKIKAVKKGLPRTVFIPTRKKYAKIIRDYCFNLPPEAYCFWAFRCEWKVKNRYKTADGESRYKENLDTTSKLKYYFNRWALNMDEYVPMYYLRHNRYSIFAEKGASIEEIRQHKGGKSLDSVLPYLHMTTDTTKKLARMI